jgi:hypothetical protein
MLAPVCGLYNEEKCKKSRLLYNTIDGDTMPPLLLKTARRTWKNGSSVASRGGLEGEAETDLLYLVADLYA